MKHRHSSYYKSAYMLREMNFNFWRERVVFVCQYYFWCMSILNMLEQYSVYVCLKEIRGGCWGEGPNAKRVFCLWERVVFGSVSSIIRLHSVSFADTITLLRFPYWHQNVGEKRRERDTFIVNVDVGQDFNSLWWVLFVLDISYYNVLGMIFFFLKFRTSIFLILGIKSHNFTKSVCVVRIYGDFLLMVNISFFCTN